MEEKSKKLGISQTRKAIGATNLVFSELAEQMGVSERTIRRWWNGQTSPTLWQFCMLLDLKDKRGSEAA